MQKNTALKLFYALIAGALFALGLVVSGMTQVTKVIGFLNIGGIFTPERFGPWDASLAFVMAGGLLVTLIAFAVTPGSGKKPWAHTKFEMPTRHVIDGKLLTGSALFGMGWGLVGYCPGPAFASLVSGGMDAAIFTLAMLAAMWVAKRFVR